VMSGRALHRISGIARELGMLEGIAPFLDQDEYKRLPRNKVCLLVTGSQGEPRAAMARIAREEPPAIHLNAGDRVTLSSAAMARISAETHPAIDLSAGDRVIFSSWAIPGNERELIDIQNMLIDRGIEVVTQLDGLVHPAGHPRREALLGLYDMVKPQVLFP